MAAAPSPTLPPVGSVRPRRRAARPSAAWLCAAALGLAATASAAGLSRPRADGLVDDFEGRVAWTARQDGGTPPTFGITADWPGGGSHGLRIEYHNGAAGWGNIQRPTAMTGKESAVTFGLRVEKADAKAAMHIWLYEADGDGWVTRVKADGAEALADLAGRTVQIRLPLADFTFEPRGQGTRDLSSVDAILIGCNYADFTALVDDLAFEVPAAVAEELRRQADERRAKTQEAMQAMGWHKSEHGNIAIFRDAVPPPKEGAPNDPDYLAEVLRRAGYEVSFITARQLALPEVLRPEAFDLLVLPYGPRFPGEAAGAFRAYLRDGGRFLSLGGYAFDEPYLAEARPDQILLGNGGFERSGEGDLPDGWLLNAPAPAVTFARATDVRRSGDASLRIAAGPDARAEWYIVRHRLDHPDRTVRYELSGWVKAEGITDGPGGYLAAEFNREGGERISFAQTDIPGNTDWRRLAVSFVVPEDAAYITVNCVLYGRGTAWFDDLELKAVPPSINTRHALPGDMLQTTEDQIPVFDPSFRLQRVARVEAAEGQYVAPAGLALPGGIEGYAATGLWGSNTAVAPEPRARWTPILRAYDEYGHLQGTVAATMAFHAGPWAGSTWAFFGATSRDLFARGDQKMAGLLTRLVAHMLRGVYLSVPEPGLMCYHDGERPSATVLVGDNGRGPQDVTVRATILDARTGKAVGEALQQKASLAPREPKTLEFTWPALKLPGDLYEMRFTAEVGGEAVDRVSTGFVMWRPAIIAKGPDLRWRDNHFVLGDAEAAGFLCGTNQTGVIVVPWWENPVTWERELAAMHDYGLRVLRFLHISAYAGADITHPEERFLRRMDAFVQMCQRHGIAAFPCMHDWMGGIAIPTDVLERQSRFAAILAERYRDVPGFIIDVENEADAALNDNAELRGMFNDYLKQVCGGDEAALRGVWGQAATFGAVPYTGPPAPTGWEDLRWLDTNLFRRQLVARWFEANCGAMRAEDKRHAITDEYYLLPGGDAGAANRWCDFINIHAYWLDQPAQLKYYDHSAEGMGFGVGEFSRRSHPSFSEQGGWGWAPETEVRRWYADLLHCDLGAGGSFACNWDWKDMESCIFPWGLTYPCDLTPKGQLHVMSALAQTLGRLPLTYAPPRTYVVIPDTQVLAGTAAEWAPALRCIELLLHCGVPFGVLHDTNLERLPAEARAVFYPCPYALTDAAYGRLLDFVRRGGTLYVSGDISYDDRRRRTKADRLAELCGVTDGGPLCPPGQAPDDAADVQPRAEGVPAMRAAACLKLQPAGAEVLAEAGGLPVLLRNGLGQGQVILCADPLELRGGPADTGLYRYVLGRAGVATLALEPAAADVTVMLPPQKTGRLAVLKDDRREGEARQVGIAGAHVGLSPGRWAMVCWDAGGRPIAAEGVGGFTAGGLTCRAGDDPVIAVALGGPLGGAREHFIASLPIIHDAYAPIKMAFEGKGLAGATFSAGEWRGGKWHGLRRLKPKAEGGGLVFEDWPSGVVVRVTRG